MYIIYIYIYIHIYVYVYIYIMYINICVRIYIYIYISRVVTPLNSSCTFRSNRGVRPGLDWSLVTSRGCEHGPFSSLICHFCYEKTCYPHVKLGHEACNGPAVFSSFQSQICVFRNPHSVFLVCPFVQSLILVCVLQCFVSAKS